MTDYTEKEFDVDKKVFKNIKKGDSGVLTYQGRRYLGFIKDWLFAPRCSHQRYKRSENNGLYRKSKLFSQNGFGFLFCCYKSVTTAI